MRASLTPTDAHAPPDRVGARYLATLAGQALRLAAAAVVAVIVPRTLGPAVYGTYTFLLQTAAMLRACVDVSSQQAFFTFSSQERASGPLTRLYALALALQFVLVMLFVGIAVAADRYEWLWPGQAPDQIFWVTLVDWALFLVLSLQQLGDSKGLTIYPQLIGAIASLLSLLALLVLWSTDMLSFYSFVWLNLSSAALTAFALGVWLVRRHRGLVWQGALSARVYLNRWWQFARPLLLLQIYLPLVSYLGIWLVQRWSGAAEQGYYALALQWSSLALIFTNAGVSIFWREIAHQSAGGRVSLAAQTYERFSRLLFFLSLGLACGLSASSATLVSVVAGEQFEPAVVAVALMAFYPAAQTLGQLSTAALKATERTSTFARWSILLSIPDLLLVWFLLAPRSATIPGLNLGAEGMAIRTALYGLASVHVLDWLNCRSMSIGFGGVLWRRVACFAMVGALAFATLRLGTAWLQAAGISAPVALSAMACAYAASLFGLLWVVPAVAGVTRAEMLRTLRGARS
jgi:O-antigen/teichoic acid export membrane protein